MHDYRQAELPAPVRALCDYAVKLRAHGWDDAAIHDAIQVIAYFNYINRIAEGVGTDPEPEWS
jgi:alkylhydroperoxidase family enzyme